MKELTPQVMREAVALIELLRCGTLSEAELSEVFLKLEKLLPDPDFLGYTVDRVPELSPEEVVKKAFSYRPIQL